VCTASVCVFVRFIGNTTLWKKSERRCEILCSGLPLYVGSRLGVAAGAGACVPEFW